MTNFRLTIEYDGRRYSGWQRQGNTDNTIQGKIEQILSRMTGHAVEINGAGRTDAGVHARAQVANVKIRTDKTAQEIQELLNHYLPQDIAVTACQMSLRETMSAHGNSTWMSMPCSGRRRTSLARMIFARCPR